MGRRGNDTPSLLLCGPPSSTFEKRVQVLLISFFVCQSKEKLLPSSFRIPVFRFFESLLKLLCNEGFIANQRGVMKLRRRGSRKERKVVEERGDKEG